jgi:hypothetical protein
MTYLVPVFLIFIQLFCIKCDSRHLLIDLLENTEDVVACRSSVKQLVSPPHQERAPLVGSELCDETTLSGITALLPKIHVKKRVIRAIWLAISRGRHAHP